MKKIIKKILIANRGEIACRIIKTARKMGISTVAVYSEADYNARHVYQADEAFFIGSSPSPSSYTNIKNLAQAAKESGADAVHPGYGFLSEKASFAEQITKNGIIFIGPSAHSIRETGDKIRAKKIATESGVNTVPGYYRSIDKVQKAIKAARKIGYPVIIKAAAGGGGKGMRIINCDDEMEQMLISAQREAKNNFADSRVFIEKYIENPRHIEIQILGDMYENYVCLGERECSIQRHHQKVIEEAPSIFINEKIRKKMYKQSIALAKATKYYSAGTVEFIVDTSGLFYFMEMNSRIQVEHPVTEMITGVDIVEQMIRIARGEELTLKQKDIEIKGHATECRVYAEDPVYGFIPSTGQVSTYIEPNRAPGVRIDSGIYEGGEVSAFYDAMISKVIVHAPTRNESIETMKKVLSEYIIEGISHNISGFLQKILNHPEYVEGNISTSFVDKVFSSKESAILDNEASAVILSVACYIFFSEQKRNSFLEPNIKYSDINTKWVIVMDRIKYPVTIRPIDEGFKVSFEHRRLYIISRWRAGNSLFQCTINGLNYSLQVQRTFKGYYQITFMDKTVMAQMITPRAAELSKYVIRPDEDKSKISNVVSIMAGSITDIKVKVGDSVFKGQILAFLEAMKMENAVISPSSGIIQAIHISKGDVVMPGILLFEIE
ncbi:Acyl-CoA carboxylase subunit alpha [Lyticum sinuosum]|uniref:propionyl-CoA carboxylase n=2 Tax=Lyticum sinuosum TaxID=1332059 RepID=A0AAE4VLW6_9RICK|nr:acetyl-CoA carboxylase biotin carboxylase subunit [Lyticum sinuosum]MDZ5761246.1 Acyl-CoA carboxylase subunit alpha [Lyticum sinuosum]